MRQPNRLFLIFLALCASVSLSWADARSDARTHYIAGQKAYASADYKVAIKEFSAAQELAPADLNNYNLALCYDKIGAADDAIKFYRAYLDRVPTTDKRPEIEASIARLQQKAPAPVPVPAAPVPAAPAPAAPVAPAPPPADPTMGPSPAPSRDPQMDRVNRVDIGAMRDQRMGAGPDAGGPPPPRDINSVGQPYANQGPPPQQGVGTAPTQQPAPGTQADVKTPDPVYKKWWFWAVVGVSAYVVYSIATEKSNDGTSGTGRLDNSLRKSARAPGPTGLTLFSW